MKRTTLTALLFCILFSLSAQEKFKFGDCPIELLEMTAYENDPDASAVVLYEKASIYYQIGSNADESLFNLVTEYVVRIKVLTQDGVDEADKAISYYVGRSKSLSENVKGLTGWTYNLEGGKVKKEKLSKDYIFTEEISENRKRIKFALPSVRIGSVIEYKYTLESPYYQHIDDFFFQRSIPVKYSAFEIRIPEYFTFNKEVKGYELIQIKEEPINMSFLYWGQSLSCSGKYILAETNDLPAMKDEKFVWNHNDFKSRISFEIRSIQFVGSYYKDYTTNWNQIVKQLNEYDKFGRQFNNNNPFKEELSAALTNSSNDTDSIRAILNLVRSKVKWNERGTLFVDNLSKAIKDGNGSSADMNAILLNTLRSAGFDANPVAMSLRSRGRLPLSYPSINDLNYFIVSVNVGDETFYLDATRPYTDLNMIPIDCLVDRALSIKESNFSWIDLTKLPGSSSRINLVYSFNEDGVLSGMKVESYYGQIAYLFNQRYSNAADEADFIKEIEAKDEITISDYKLEKRVAPAGFGSFETIKFVKESFRLGDNIISFNPLLFLGMRENTFKAETRKLPVEFSFPYIQRIGVTFTIPDGYELDEAPQSERFFFEGDWIDYSYMLQQTGNTIQIMYTLKLNTVIVPTANYEYLRVFWAKMYNKEHEMITIRKKTEL